MNSYHKSSDYFPSDYFSARERFLQLAREAGARVASHPIDARGPDDRLLSIDTAYLGAEEPQCLLIILSGTHGVEGFAGSALQQQWLARDAAALPREAGCLLIHALNPYGFAWVRRANENNVDLNRNALERFPGPPNPAYRPLDRWLNPPSPPRALDAFLARGVVLLARHGLGALQQAIVGGQYEYPRGLFYGGAQAEASTRFLYALLADARWRSARRILAIDIHTGLGRRGAYKLLVDEPPDSGHYRDFVSWFGAENVACSSPADRLAYTVAGGVTHAIAHRLGPERTYAGVLEFGTASPARVLAALRRENRAYHYGGHVGSTRQRAVAMLREALCPSDTAWREALLRNGGEMLVRAQRACLSPARAATVPAPRAGE